ncbi:hypothetical protein [Azospirillum halopraeferens]|nr:hypothetical protein [Azospirillum halopraeferens]
MAKERKRGNRDVRKPKQRKGTAAASAATLKALLTPATNAKKKA